MSGKIRIVIIEDSAENCAAMAMLLERQPGIEICGATENALQGTKMVLEHLPDAVFMYSHESYYHNFGIIEDLKQNNCLAPIVFTVKDDNYLHDIVRNHAFTCLRKPVKEKELHDCLRKLYNNWEYNNKSDVSLLQIHRNSTVKIRFNTRTGFVLVDPEDVLFCKAAQNYTELYLSETEKILATVQLGRIANLLNHTSLKRVGKSFIVNTRYITGVDRKLQKCYFKRNGKIFPLHLSGAYLKMLGGLLQ